MNKEKIKEKVIIALKIREEIQNIFKKYNVSTSYCNDDTNPYYNQTDENTEGFICEYYYGSPSKIYTPLGYIDIWSGFMCGGEEHNKAIEEIKRVFGFIKKQESYNNSLGTIGGWYYITKLPWDNSTLECNCVVRNSKDFIPYKEARELYKQF